MNTFFYFLKVRTDIWTRIRASLILEGMRNTNLAEFPSVVQGWGIRKNQDVTFSWGTVATSWGQGNRRHVADLERSGFGRVACAEHRTEGSRSGTLCLGDAAPKGAFLVWCKGKLTCPGTSDSVPPAL